MSAATHTQPRDPESQAGAWAELAFGVVRSVHAHAGFLKAEEREQFQGEMDALLTALNDSPSASVLHLTTVTLEVKIREYFERAQSELDRSLGELRQLVSVLMSSLTQVDQTNQNTGSSLMEIGKIVQAARTPGELVVAKIHLVQALDRLKAEASVRRQANSELLTMLQRKAHAVELVPGIEEPLAASGVSTGSLSSAIGPADPVTGLYGRQAAEAFLLNLNEKAKATAYIVAFYVQRTELINSRFGDRMGTDVLAYCAQQFARLAQPGDHLFRWRGPSFVAVLSRGRSLSDVRQELNSAYRNRMTFEGADNSALIPLSVVTQIWPARKAPPVELIHNVEGFFSMPSTRAVSDSPDSAGRADAGDEDFGDFGEGQ